MPKITVKASSTTEMITKIMASTSRRNTGTRTISTSLTAVEARKRGSITDASSVSANEFSADTASHAEVIAKTISKVSTSSTPQPRQTANIEAALDSLEADTMGASWRTALKPEFKKDYFRKLKEYLVSEHTSHVIYPELHNIYSWSRLTHLNEVKVIILGQDPYHNIGQAHGLSFSVLPPTKPPGSLKNIYKQLSIDIPGFITPSSGDLSSIARQGVLWLNTSLTVRAHKAASHANKGWETFTAQVIRGVMQRENSQYTGIVFMAWGLPAQKTCAKIGIDQKKHLLLQSPHPSPLSAHRGFLGNGHFRLANEWLKEKYGDEAQIDWTILNPA